MWLHEAAVTNRKLKKQYKFSNLSLSQKSQVSRIMSHSRGSDISGSCHYNLSNFSVRREQTKKLYSFVCLMLFSSIKLTGCVFFFIQMLHIQQTQTKNRYMKENIIMLIIFISSFTPFLYLINIIELGKCNHHRKISSIKREKRWKRKKNIWKGKNIAQLIVININQQRKRKKNKLYNIRMPHY